MWITSSSDNSVISLEEFMRRALHDPQHGYYARRIGGIGRRGDFTTAPMISCELSQAISCWSAGALKESGCCDLIEIGPGEGLLAAEVMRQLPWSMRWKTRLHLVETSGPLLRIQSERLGRRASWHPSMAGALAACKGRAVIFSNELVDAFPARVFERTTEGWREVALKFGEQGSVAESLLPAAPLPASSVFSVNHPQGQRVEVHDSYRRWLQDWLPHWRAGRMLTIDYGATADTLYHRRPRGTLRGYLLQQRVEGHAVYLNPGRQDITADVNFTDLIEWSQPAAARHRLQNLAEFLGQHGQQGDTPLADPAGAGGAFKVLDQVRAC